MEQQSFSDFTIEISELKEILLTYLTNYIQLNEELDDSGLSLLYCCRERVDPQTNVVYLDNKALQLMKNFIVAHPKGYIQLFVRSTPYGNPVDSVGGSIYPEPFWKQIFGSIDDFESFILNQKLSSIEGIEKVRNFWKLYKNNNCKRLEFAHTDIGYYEDVLMNNSEMLILKVDKLLEMKKRLDEIEKDLANSRDKSCYNRYLEDINEFGEVQKEINLLISLNNNINEQKRKIISTITDRILYNKV